MAYATESDILTRFEGVDADPGDDKFQTAIDDAAAIIDGHLAGRYSLPLATVPSILKSVCVDLAIYGLARDQSGLTEDIRKRYEDARSYLRSVAKGEIKLPGQDSPSVDKRTGAAVIMGAPRVMGRGRGY